MVTNRQKQIEGLREMAEIARECGINIEWYDCGTPFDVDAIFIKNKWDHKIDMAADKIITPEDYERLADKLEGSCE